jgi:hypothetical protein
MFNRNQGPKTLLTIMELLAVLSVVLFTCSCGMLIFRMMLGSPWLIDLAAFAA